VGEIGRDAMEMRSRRQFVESGAAVCGLILCPLATRRVAAGDRETHKAPVFDETMAYCCAECTPEKCKWLSDDMEWKTQKAREVSEKIGRTIKPEEVTCSRCRIPEKRTAEGLKRCPIRACVVGKDLVSCAHCRELAECKIASPQTRERALAIQRIVLGPSGGDAK
jgi:hypothetical protein